MALFWQHSAEDCLLGIWRMDETYEELCEMVADRQLVQEAEIRFNAPRRRQEWLSVRILLRTISGNRQDIRYMPSGRPYLPDERKQISISHTKGYATVIISEYTVGIDIEQYGRKVHHVADRYMRDDEQAIPFRGDDTWSLLLHWSAKETVYKCLDTEDVDFCRHLQVTPFVPQEVGCFSVREYRTKARSTFLIHYMLHEDFVLTWTVCPHCNYLT